MLGIIVIAVEMWSLLISTPCSGGGGIKPRVRVLPRDSAGISAQLVKLRLTGTDESGACAAIRRWISLCADDAIAVKSDGAPSVAIAKPCCFKTTTIPAKACWASSVLHASWLWKRPKNAKGDHLVEVAADGTQPSMPGAGMG